MSHSRAIRCLAVVNRGEAAMRCIAAVKTLRAEEGSSLRAIALYTDVDRDAPFVRHADRAIRLPATPGGEVAAYLDHDLVVDALRAAGADAVWPGWGFVAEDPGFVERMAFEGIAFLGPSADAMRTLADKVAAKRVAECAGVPVTRWCGGLVETVEQAETAAAELGFPVVIKAAAGGGGRGIRMVDRPSLLADAFRAARSEAESAFGDGRLFLEAKVEGARHVEVQIAADLHGVVHALGCRDCSVQRRHQKLLEEAPPPGVSSELRRTLEADAVRIARAVTYAGVGTVEFLVSEGDYQFVEMNPRLQVEHGVTEAITGVDLVQLQIRIARGESLEGLAVGERGHAIEARICAEDPEAGFLPSPGRIGCFDAARGPKVRVDSGVCVGSTVPAAFDSLLAKVIATGETREEARSRLVCALSDFDLVVEGGATNKGYLIDALCDPAFRRGAVDTDWLDRFSASRSVATEYAVEALVAAAIIAYQRARYAIRLNFFADTANMIPSRLPPARGQEIDLRVGGEQYRLEVFAIGSWQYRVHLDGRVIAATLREEGPFRARLEIHDRALRVVYDATDARLRVEIEGRPHTFDRDTAGQVRASTPAMVVAIDVQPGDRVEAGRPLGVLEAMKMEIGFDAPLSGVVTEVRARKGQQVRAGDVLVVIGPSREKGPALSPGRRLRFPDDPDLLAPLFAASDEGRLGAPDLVAADRAEPATRRAAIAGVREEVRRVLLGYDANTERAELLASFLEAPLPEGLSEDFRWELAELRAEIRTFADVDQLFIRSPRASVSGELGPSNNARLRMFVRRLRAGGAGIAPEFLNLVSRALAHYGLTSLEPCDALERATLRLLSSQLSSDLRQRLLLAVIRCVRGLTRSGVHLHDDRDLADALGRIARMRGLVTDAVADEAVEARYVSFERPEIERQAERTSKELEAWLDAAESEPTPPPEAVLRHLADAPRNVFDRVGRWLADADRRRRAIALGAHLRRLYSPAVPLHHASLLHGDGSVDHLEFAGARIVVGCVSDVDGVVDAVTRLREAVVREREGDEWRIGYAMELFVPVADESQRALVVARVHEALIAGVPADRFTVNCVAPGGRDLHETFASTREGLQRDESLHGIHPEAARRIQLERLANFELERCDSPADIYCFHGRSREVTGDERVFVLADMRGRSPDDGHEARLHVPAFEHAFHEATRTLRNTLGVRDPARRLQWNRISIFAAPEILLDRETAAAISRSLAPASRNLGLEKVVVSLKLLDRDAPGKPAQPVEIVVSDLTGSNMEIHWRAPRRNPLAARSEYERKVVDARRRRLVYPYEVIRMLTGGQRQPAGGASDRSIPVGTFEEYDVDPDSTIPVARSVEGRPYGMNTSAVVFGVVTAPTDPVPEGMARVLILSDPTIGMGSLAAPECDRIIAAIDLAERRRIPVEWIPISSGARIALDSGTENLDATARVARRIVTFTGAGGVIHLIVHGVNVGAQSYWNALASMLMHTRGALIMTPRASMVLTGRAALEASGAVSAEDEVAIGGFERIMGPNGEAQYYASDLADAYRILYDHYRYTYVMPGEAAPRERTTADLESRSVLVSPVVADGNGVDFRTVGEIFDDETNPGRKRPFPMRALMDALVDSDGGHLERWRPWVGAETAVVWDAYLGGIPVCLIGIESQNVARDGYRPPDGPASWTAGTLFPLSSKKVARALNAASRNRPTVVLANLSGFDGSPESMRKLQLEYGAEIVRAVVGFEGPIIFLVVSRYHGGAYVVFSQALMPNLRASALTGSFASVIGGRPAAAVVFSREVRARAVGDPRVLEVQGELRANPSPEARERYARVLDEVVMEKQAELAQEFDAIHTVERARDVGSLAQLVEPRDLRPFLIREVRRGLDRNRRAELPRRDRPRPSVAHRPAAR